MTYNNYWTARTPVGRLAGILNRLSNGLVESTNTKIRVLTRIAYGFTNTDHRIALALLDRGSSPTANSWRA